MPCQPNCVQYNIPDMNASIIGRYCITIRFLILLVVERVLCDSKILADIHVTLRPGKVSGNVHALTFQKANERAMVEATKYERDAVLLFKQLAL